MKILVTLDRADCRGWLLALDAALRAAGHEVAFLVRSGRPAARDGAGMVLGLERRLYRGACPACWEPLPEADLPAGQAGTRLELSAAPGAALSLFIEGEAGIGSLPARLMSGGAPHLSIRDQEGALLATAIPAREDPLSLARSLANVTTRIGTLACMALDGQSAARPQVSPEPVVGKGSALPFVLGALARKLAARLLPGSLRQDHWRVGIRPRRDGAGFRGSSAVSGFEWLPDDGARFYADPILFEEGGKTYLFVEEFPYALGRGIIAYTELDDTGRARFAPRPIIRREGHLSYPLLFRHGGEIYMMPENAEEGHVPLYRARRFPDDWEELPPLLDVALHDATPVEIDGRFWVLGNAALNGGSSWDCLMAYCAPGPLGPFAAHVANPLMVDARATRPGGPVFEEAGQSIRTVQDCLAGYGHFKRFFAIEALTSAVFRQSEMGQWHPESAKDAGVHTFSRSSGFEATDARASRSHSRLRQRHSLS